ncbi:MAG: hypothetical protein KGL35_15465 [Bradyrhizobium sp.]|nr:hypothetical protein [Bradyrhizobium sp.]
MRADSAAKPHVADLIRCDRRQNQALRNSTIASPVAIFPSFRLPAP